MRKADDELDVPDEAACTAVSEIRIALYEHDPPAGWVIVGCQNDADDVSRMAFEGWLGLLHVLGQIFTTSDAATSPD